MVVLDGNFALGCGHGTDYTLIHIFQCMLERTDAITNKVLELITFVLAYPTVFPSSTNRLSSVFACEGKKIMLCVETRSLFRSVAL